MLWDYMSTEVVEHGRGSRGYEGEVAAKFEKLITEKSCKFIG